MGNHPRFDYEGGEFGRPGSKFLSRSWRLQKGVFAPRAVPASVPATLLGQDSVGVSALSPGLPVYAGYNYGTFDNWNALVARFGKTGAHLVSITPVVQGLTKCRVLDIEPGDATPADAPSFQRQGNQSGGLPPMYYTSAGDVRAVISHLTAAGFPRSSYFIWSAHWIGKHICGPSTCGYPQADATQYASNNAFDSDIFDVRVFGGKPPPPSPHPVLSLTLPLTRDPVNGVNAVHALQARLNVWAKVRANPVVTEDGVFGQKTEAAVRAFQTNRHMAVDGSVGSATWAELDATPIVPPVKPEAPLVTSSHKFVTTKYALNLDRTIHGYKGDYETTIDGSVAGKAWKFTPPLTPGNVTVPLPGPGTYTIATTASGFSTRRAVVIV